MIVAEGQIGLDLDGDKCKSVVMLYAKADDSQLEDLAEVFVRKRHACASVSQFSVDRFWQAPTAGQGAWANRCHYVGVRWTCTKMLNW